jgi:hypothetical protein
MSTKQYHPITARYSHTPRERVQQEIEDYLQALSSYPDRFAREPRLSFEQHLVSIIASGQLAHAGSKNDPA